MNHLDQIAGRPAQYLSETGTPQLLSGLVLLILGSCALIQTLMTAPGVVSLVVQYAGLCLVGIVWWRLSALKRRVVFPRGGYVKARGAGRTRLVTIAVACAGLAYSGFAVSWSGFRAAIESPLLWPAFLILFAIICLAARRKNNAPTVWFGVYMASLAPLVWLLQVNNYARSGVLMVALGAPIAVLGALRLRRFVRSNPMPPEPRNE